MGLRPRVYRRNLTHVEYPISELNRRFVRVVLEDENGKRAWSNPIVLDK